MQLTPDIILSLIGSAIAGAMTAWLGNKIVHAEMWGHIKRHCAEFERMERRLNAHSDKLGVIQQALAILDDAKARYERQCEREER